MSMKIQAGVVGATGYAGAELCRILTGHPGAELAAVSSVSFEGKRLSEIYPSYYQMCEPVCGKQEEVVEKSDVIFAALPHGLSQELAAECDAKGKVFIDLGARTRRNIRSGTATPSSIPLCMRRPCTACRSCSATRSGEKS